MERPWTGLRVIYIIGSNMYNTIILNHQSAQCHVVYPRDLFFVRFCLSYIQMICQIVWTNAKAILFADDTTLYISSSDVIELYSFANDDLNKLTE